MSLLRRVARPMEGVMDRRDLRGENGGCGLEAGKVNWMSLMGDLLDGKSREGSSLVGNWSEQFVFAA
jgi:hypothetical protein